MKNVIMSILAKISKMDAETKELTARVEAQSLLISALFITVSKKGGVEEMVASVNKAINAVLESSDDAMKSDAELLFTHFQELISTAKMVNDAASDDNTDVIDSAAIEAIAVKN
ncbi:anti-adapter protein IraP [Erwinia sp. PK3-005]